MKKYLKRATAVLTAVMMFSSVLGGVSMAEGGPLNTAERKETIATSSNADRASASNALKGIMSLSTEPSLTFNEDCIVEYEAYENEASISNIQFSFTDPENKKYEYLAYFDLTGPDEIKKEKVLETSLSGEEGIRTVGFLTEKLEPGHYEISARIVSIYDVNVTIGHSSNTLSFNVGYETEWATYNFPIKTLEGKEANSADYALYPAVIFMFGRSNCVYCQNSLKNLNGILGAYNQGDIKAFFFDIDSEPEETEKLAAISKKIEFCNQKASGIDYNRYAHKIAAEHEITRTKTPSVFIFSRGQWAGGSGDGEWSAEKFNKVFKDLGIQKTEEKKTAIKNFYRDHTFSLSGSPSWMEQPSWRPPYLAGKLSEKSVQDGLNALNFVRFIADVPADVTSNKDYEKQAQAGAVILERIGELTHYPNKPSDMTDEFFQLGYMGTSQSNLEGASNWRAKSLSWSIINGWMNDADSSNIDRVGHRRWCLNPSMAQTGFGVAGGFSAMYSLDMENPKALDSSPYVAWPAKVMPSEYFKGPWSVSVDSSKYTIDQETAAVTLTSGSKTYRLSSKDGNGYFNVDKGGYGMGDTIIFKPTAAFGSGASVTVAVEGVQSLDGDPKELVYMVNFFDMSGSSGGGGGGSSSGGGGGSSSGGGGGSSSRRSDASIPTRINPTLIPTGETITSGTWKQQSDLTWQLLDNTGNAVSSRWAFLEGKYYLLGSDSIMKTGWQMVNNVWYYMNSDGSMAVGWQHLNNEWYYLKPDGAMATGWISVNGKEYYLDATGKMLANGLTPDGQRVNNLGEKV